MSNREKKRIENKKRSKMYILVRDSMPMGIQANSVAHAALGCYLKFKEHPSVDEWLQYSFRKVTCEVTDEEFKAAKLEADDWVLITEDTMGGAEIAIAFRPRSNYPESFKKFQLYGKGFDSG